MKINSPKTEQEVQQLFQQACTFHEENNFVKAEKIYKYLADHFPDAFIVHYNYGLLLLEKKAYKEALFSCEKAVELSPDSTDALFNYALCLKNCGNFSLTISTYKKILTLLPDDIDSLYNLACCYKDCGETEKAINSFEKVLTHTPANTSALNNLAYLHHKQGNLQTAQKLYERLISVNPNHTSATHMLASIRGDEVKVAPSEYVSEVFDTYSTHYEQSLVSELHYDVPNKMRAHFNAQVNEGELFEHGIDLGCGTGLAALAFGDLCQYLTGIDLSKKMLLEAEKKETYNTLIAMDIVEFLQKKETMYSLILASDVFTYLGDLQPLFQEISCSAAENGYFCFSTETTSAEDFKLRQTGRFAHSPSYILDLAEKTDWKVLLNTYENLRMEKNQWIKGAIYLLQKRK